jgi:Cu+-exporting ATPase
MDVFSGRGAGYLDSLAGLVFFLLCGRAFQQKTHDRLAFDRDYKCFFPLCAIRKTPEGEESVAISQVKVGDQLLVRNGELVPADATLLSNKALLDYSFATGESEPVVRTRGDHLYAGARQAGEAIEVETLKPVSQSYLTSLWNHEAFRKNRETDLHTLTNRYSRRFTRVVIAVAIGAGLFWLLSGDSPKAIKAFISVLIVACPCALALAAPFTMGTAQRLLARLSVFVKNVFVLERMAEVHAIVFDKTGTLTAARRPRLAKAPGPEASDENPGFESLQFVLTQSEKAWVYSLARQSTHPLSVSINAKLGDNSIPKSVREFREISGCGIEGKVDGHHLRLGSSNWLVKCGISVPQFEPQQGSISCLAIDGRFRGVFILSSALRPETERLMNKLGERYELALLSGDNARERERFRRFFGPDAHLHFNQSPPEKLEFISGLQKNGRKVMMVGDGLNDAGALKQSDVGVAVIENAGAFSPASDVILDASEVPNLFKVLSFSRKATRVVRVSFAISACYNVVGVSIAAAGVLSPLVCAVLMPLSSLSVVLFACAATTWCARRSGLLTIQTPEAKPQT